MNDRDAFSYIVSSLVLITVFLNLISNPNFAQKMCAIILNKKNQQEYEYKYCVHLEISYLIAYYFSIISLLIYISMYIKIDTLFIVDIIFIFVVLSIPDLLRMTIFNMKRGLWKNVRDYISHILHIVGTYAVWRVGGGGKYIFLLSLSLRLYMIGYYRIMMAEKVEERELSKDTKWYRLQGLFDSGLRSFFHATISITMIELILFFDGVESCSKYFSCWVSGDGVEAMQRGVLITVYYFNVLSATTVGYGDVYPSVPTARLFVSITFIYYSFLVVTLIQIGVAKLTAPASERTEGGGK